MIVNTALIEATITVVPGLKTSEGGVGRFGDGGGGGNW